MKSDSRRSNNIELVVGSTWSTLDDRRIRLLSVASDSVYVLLPTTFLNDILDRRLCLQFMTDDFVFGL